MGNIRCDIMARNENDSFRRKLVEAREAIIALQDERNASSATVMLEQSSVGRLSRMDALQQQAMAQNSQKRAETALRRCDDGSYGYCLDCDGPIDARRLALDPATALCIACAEIRDRGK